MTNGNHILGIASLLISAVIGSVYITREISADKEIKSRIEQLETNKKILDNRIDSLSKQVALKDMQLLANIDSAYTNITQLNTQSQVVKQNIKTHRENLQSEISETKRLIDEFNKNKH
jgi:outer membrane murein-binding lipoprotein Lpp